MGEELNFVPGQVWMQRDGQDLWTVEAITNHPVAPIIARHECQAIRDYGRNGYLSPMGHGDDEPSDLDLVTLVKDV